MRTTWKGFAAVACAAAVAVQAGCAGRQPPAADAPEPARDADTRRSPTGTGAVGVIDERDLALQRVQRVEELLHERIAGVSVMRTGDGDYAVRIRGGRGLEEGEPLFVVDGMPIPGSARGALAGISPHDVARIEVLKDAAAVAPYGVQGRNGVILVTTRRRD